LSGETSSAHRVNNGPSAGFHSAAETGVVIEPKHSASNTAEVLIWRFLSSQNGVESADFRPQSWSDRARVVK
jgi:hypothetical protein